MTLSEFVAQIEGRRKRLTLVNPEMRPIADEVAEYFVDQNVDVVVDTTESGRPSGLVVLSRDGEYLAGTSTERLTALMHDTPAGPDGLGFDDSGHESLLQHLKETTFTSNDRSDMMAATREIEDRAWREGGGRLYAGFQTAANLERQRREYLALGATNLSVHAFVVRDGDVPRIDGVEVHAVNADEIADHWFVAFDGAGDEMKKSALVAADRGDGRFYGFWTYDPSVVDGVTEYLDEAYRKVEV